MKLTIENFQSLEGKVELDFKPGINLIVGPSNSGKTAIQRALRGLVLNYRGNVKKYLTHFKDKLEVNLQLTEDGSVYTWSKDKNGKTFYKIVDEDGDVQEYEKAGNEDVYSYDPKFPFVLREKQLINTYTEKEGLPFPFNLTDLEMFKMFEELYNISSSATILNFMKKLESSTNSSINKNKEAIATNKERIEAIIEVEDKYNLEKLESLKRSAEAFLTGMQGIDDDLATARKNNKISKAIKEVLDNRRDSEEIDEKLEKLSTKIKDIKELHKDIKIVDSCSQIEQIHIYKKEFDTAVIEPYKALCSEYELANSLEKELKSLQEDQKELEEELAEVKEKLAEVDVCPLCGQAIKGEHDERL